MREAAVGPLEDEPESLKAALAYADLGLPVLPGTAWDGCWFRHPFSGATAPALQPLMPPTGATTSEGTLRAWWGCARWFSPTVLLQSGAAFDVLTADIPVVRSALSRGAFRFYKGAVLCNPWWGKAMILVEPGAAVPECVAKPTTLEVMPPTWIAVTPTQARGVAASWWIPPEAPSAIGNSDMVATLLMADVAAAQPSSTRTQSLG
ncbi:hypothetical protein JOF53_006472 [Crossiella equi]|uniref:Uncharacterized protein n=1 Tax=Crossiella equi TaxID=130796 RepID=A0ABS5AM01_9PSEU|nr:hypothetical protein [Crossiella equi]MBP2477600.1 hypothetical protein [Crossiella equi]